MILRTGAILLALTLLARCAPTEEADKAAAPPDPMTVANNTPFEWPSFDEAVVTGQREGKPVLIDIYAPWCGWCARMQQEVYGNTTLAAYVQHNFAYGRLNIDDHQTRHNFMGYTFTSQELGYALGASGTPTTVFLSEEGTYITRLAGYTALEPFGEALRYIVSGAYQSEQPGTAD